VKGLPARYAVQADPLRSERRVELAVLVCGALLGLLALYLLLRVVLATDIKPIAPAPDSVRVATVAGDDALLAEEREVLLARPLFWAGRTPEEEREAPEVVAEVETKEKAAPRMKDVTVWGIYGSGDTGGVILSVKQRQLRLAVGEEVDGWRLDRVTGDSAVFISGGVRDERELVPQVIEVSSVSAGTGSAAGDPAAQAADNGTGESAEEEPRRLTLGGVR